MDLLQGQLSDGLVNQLSQQLGGASKEQTKVAANGIFAALVNGMAKNASTPEGAASLANALDRDHDGGVLSDLMGLIGGKSNVQNSRTTNGAGIVKHTLGEKSGGVVDMISRMSGLSSGKTGNLMTMLAPMVMGMLGQQKNQQGLNLGMLTNLLTGSASASRKNSDMGMVAKFLDSDGDGNVMDDVASIGMKVLGNFFKR